VDRFRLNSNTAGGNNQ